MALCLLIKFTEHPIFAHKKKNQLCSQENLHLYTQQLVVGAHSQPPMAAIVMANLFKNTPKR